MPAISSAFFSALTSCAAGSRTSSLYLAYTSSKLSLCKKSGAICCCMSSIKSSSFCPTYACNSSSSMSIIFTSSSLTALTSKPALVLKSSRSKLSSTSLSSSLSSVFLPFFLSRYACSPAGILPSSTDSVLLIYFLYAGEPSSVGSSCSSLLICPVPSHFSQS